MQSGAVLTHLVCIMNNSSMNFAQTTKHPVLCVWCRRRRSGHRAAGDGGVEVGAAVVAAVALGGARCAAGRRRHPLLARAVAAAVQGTTGADSPLRCMDIGSVQQPPALRVLASAARHVSPLEWMCRIAVLAVLRESTSIERNETLCQWLHV